MDYISLKKLCEKLSISTATGRNWIKLGKSAPEFTEKRLHIFRKNMWKLYAQNFNQVKTKP